MKIRCLFLSISILTIPHMVSAQYMEKAFHGFCDSTSWTFHFHNNGTYQRTYSGRYTFTTYGTYRLTGDTIVLLTGLNTGLYTHHERYLLDSNMMLTDLWSRYDFAPFKDTGQTRYYSKLRNVKYPQIPSADPYIKEDLEQLLNAAFNSETFKAHVTPEHYPLLVTNYFSLEATIRTDSTLAVFKPLKNINERFFIELEDINQNRDYVTFAIIIHGAGIRMQFFYNKQHGTWFQNEPLVYIDRH